MARTKKSKHSEGDDDTSQQEEDEDEENSTGAEDADRTPFSPLPPPFSPVDKTESEAAKDSTHGTSKQIFLICSTSILILMLLFV